jgi:hypothetical protein
MIFNLSGLDRASARKADAQGWFCVFSAGSLALGALGALVASSSAQAAPIEAAQIVGGVMGAQVLSSELKNDKPVVKAKMETAKEAAAARVPAAVPTPAQLLAANDGPSETESGESKAHLAPKTAALSLPSRLELTAGTDGLIQLSDVRKQVSLFAQARYRISGLIQLGGSMAYRSQSTNDTSDAAFQLLLGPTFNFPVNEAKGLENAFFVSPRLGLTTGKTMFGDIVVKANTQFTMALDLGKRFRLADGIAYAPSIGVVKERDFSASLVIQPISLSIFF